MVVPEEGLYGESDGYPEDEDQTVAAANDRRTVLRKPLHERIIEEKSDSAATAPAAIPAPEPAKEILYPLPTMCAVIPTTTRW